MIRVTSYTVLGGRYVHVSTMAHGLYEVRLVGRGAMLTTNSATDAADAAYALCVAHGIDIVFCGLDGTADKVRNRINEIERGVI